jgi:hypothetical protein
MLTVNKSLGYLFILTLIGGLFTILIISKVHSSTFEIDQHLTEIAVPIEKPQKI